ncbi:MAG TPA: hypothetical protein VEG38_09055 [Acidimicrobiia bacterium]|nr:hypothetical protein [Acidimicrobiia bacterium]
MTAFATSKRRAVSRLGAVLLIGGSAGLGLAGGAGADESSGVSDSYTLTARADTFAFQFVETAAPAAPGGEIFYATPSTAQALLDSVGRAEGYAAAPSPGPFFATLPGNGNGVLAGFGIPFAFPDYPFYAASSHPVTPQSDKAFGPFRARAESHALRAVGDARSGGLTNDDPALFSSRASAVVNLDPNDKTRTAMAESRLDGFTTGPLAIGQSLASARITQAPGAPPKKESSFTLGSFTIAGVQIAMTDDGFKLGDQAPPTADMAQLFGILAQAGITVEFLPASETPTSIDSAGLRITRAGVDPNGTQYKVALVLGRVGASVTGGATPVISGEPTVVPEAETSTPTEPVTGSGSAVPDPAVPEAVQEPTVANVAAEDGAFAAGAIVDPGPDPETGPPNGAAYRGPVEMRLASPVVAVPDGGPDTTAFYLALLVAGALMTAGSRLMSMIGVRLGRSGIDASTPSVLRLPGR